MILISRATIEDVENETSSFWLNSSCSPADYEKITTLCAMESARDELKFLKEAVGNFRYHAGTAFADAASYIRNSFDSSETVTEVERGKLRCIIEFRRRELANLKLIESLDSIDPF